MINTLEKMAAIFKRTERLTEWEYIQGLSSLVALDVCHILLNDEAILLMDVYGKFQEYAIEYANKVHSYNLPGSRWLQVYLSNTLKSTLGSAVRHRCYGTILFKQNGDHLKALSKALGELRSKKKIEIDLRKQLSMSTVERQHSQVMPVSTETIIDVCKYLNEIINDNTKRLVEKYNNNPYLYSQFTFHNFAESLDKILITVIGVLTQPVRGKRKLLPREDDKVSKFTKQLYCLLVLFYTTNNQYYPLHYILTDSIICHHGSSVLVKILNRVGACISLDTHDRITNQIATSRLYAGIMPYI